MRDWFENLSLRERLIVLGGGILTGLMLYWLLIWDPLVRKTGELETSIQEQTRVLSYLQQTARQARQLRAQTGRPVNTGNRSLLAVVDGSSKQSGINTYIKRMQPDGQKSVRLWLEQAPFDDLLNWLSQLDGQHGVAVSAASIDRQDKDGTVKARLTLKRGQG